MKRTTSSPELLVRLDRSAAEPLRVQLELELRCAIHQGRLAVGTILPSTRALAADLGVSRGVVVEAYEQLFTEGYLSADHGSATRVAAHRADMGIAAPPPAPAPRPRYDFRPGLPDLALFPRAAWLTSMRRALTKASIAAFDYPEPRGVAVARIALARYLSRVRGTAAHSDHVVVCTGAAQAIALICAALRDRGVRQLAVEDPGLSEQYEAIEALGLRTVRIPVDGEGMRVDRLARSRAGAVLVTPAHQYPGGAVLAPERRAALLDWATRRNAWILEDDYDAEYRYDRQPVAALQGLAPDRVLYIGTASKTLSPALRLAWILSPAALAPDLARAKQLADNGSAVPEQLALADFLERGEFDRHLRATRLIYRRRRDALVKALETHLPGLPIQGTSAGLHLMIELPRMADERAVVASAAERSIRVFGGRKYRGDPDAGPPALVLGYGAMEAADLAEGIRRLARVLEENDAAG